MSASIHAEIPNTFNNKDIQDTILSPAVKSTIYEIKNTVDNVAEKSKQFFHQIETKVVNTPVKALIGRIHAICTNIERVFNVLGCIPFIGASSGSLRAAIGHIQILAGVILTTLGEIGVFVCKMRKSDAELMEKWKAVSIIGNEQILHGCLNVIRGYGEALIGTYSLGLANVVLLVPNTYKEDAFSPYFSYGSLMNIDMAAIKA